MRCALEHLSRPFVAMEVDPALACVHGNGQSCRANSWNRLPYSSSTTAYPTWSPQRICTNLIDGRDTTIPHAVFCKTNCAKGHLTRRRSHTVQVHMQRGLLLLSDRMKSITKIAHVQCYGCLYIPAGFNTDIPAATPQWVRLVPQERFGLLAQQNRRGPILRCAIPDCPVARALVIHHSRTQRARTQQNGLDSRGDRRLTAENILDMNNPMMMPTESASHVGTRRRGCLRLGCMMGSRLIWSER